MGPESLDLDNALAALARTCPHLDLEAQAAVRTMLREVYGAGFEAGKATTAKAVSYDHRGFAVEHEPTKATHHEAAKKR